MDTSEKSLKGFSSSHWCPLFKNRRQLMAETMIFGNATLDGQGRWCSNTTKRDYDDSFKHFYDIAQLTTGLIIYPIVCFPGVVGNALTIFVLSRRNMHTSTNAFLSALAVADSIKLVNDILYFFVSVFMRTSSKLGNLSYGYLYPYAHFVFSLSVSVSSWLTVSVAVERYIMVCHPTRAKAVWSRRRAVFLCAFIYIVMSTLALPSALRYRTIRCVDQETKSTRLDVELTDMWQNTLFVTIYTWCQNLLRSIIPLIALVILNACIITKLRRTKAKRRKNARHRVTIMMIVVILVFLICITPDAILSTAFGFGYHESGYLTRAIREITDTLLAISAGVNFLIYCAFNHVFRKSFTRVCCPVRRASNSWMTELDESTYRRLSEARTVIMSNIDSSLRKDASPTLDTPTSKYAAPLETSFIIETVPVSRSQVDNESTSLQLKSGLSSCVVVVKDENILKPSDDSQSFLKDKTNQAGKSYRVEPGNGLFEPTQALIVHPAPRLFSSRLKKSKNSIKCNRKKGQLNVVTFKQTSETIEKSNADSENANYIVRERADSLCQPDTPSTVVLVPIQQRAYKQRRECDIQLVNRKRCNTELYVERLKNTEGISVGCVEDSSVQKHGDTIGTIDTKAGRKKRRLTVSFNIHTKPNKSDLSFGRCQTT
ncbi:neuromedin-U receptor 2-like isoform X2 [Physella acuta]|uniref:neuromedin-U receptor 2-like isoform X2 n=1 Tax=Physella acuta TaxID=109671 RepID=UPI0027DAD814|nr:neuromedin-U receptor 2-like isoform X2 [Physella acuta]